MALMILDTRVLLCNSLRRVRKLLIAGAQPPIPAAG